MQQLSSQQLAAVKTSAPVSLVVAGAGSGKTRVITSRIKFLIQNGAAPSSILCLTFTNKAANEMKERLKHMLPDLEKMPFVGTFHSFCLATMKSNPRFFGDNFAILDEHDQQQLLNRILKQNGLEKQLNARKALSAISRYKNGAAQDNQEEMSRLMTDLLQEYEKEKTANNSLDFDDLVINVVVELQKNSLFAQLLHNKYRHVLIDEYQDTNAIQHRLIKLLVCDADKKFVAQSVFAVGDQDQSIYSWRGATANNMQDFMAGFGHESALFKLEQNYRSVQPILQLANEVIKHNGSRIEKSLWSDNKTPNRVLRVEVYDEYREADLIAQTCRNFLAHSKPEQLAVLIRSHAQSRILEEKFIEQSVMYKIVGAVKFYDRREIRDCLALLRFCANHVDRQSFTRLTTFALQGCGQTFLDRFFDYMHSSGDKDILHALNVVVREQPFKINKTQVQKIEEFCHIFAGLDAASSPERALEKLLDCTNYREFLQHEYLENDSRDRVDNVDELVKATQRFEHRVATQTSWSDEGAASCTLKDYLLDVALLEDATEHEDANPVLILTLHAAKGLEFDHVFIPGVEENIIPMLRADTLSAQIEEECRLFYVGITRAKKSLILVHGQSRNCFGTRVNSNLSRFLDNISSTLVQPLLCHSPCITSKTLSSWLCGNNLSGSAGDAMNNVNNKNLYTNFIPSKAKVDAKPAGLQTAAAPAVTAKTPQRILPATKARTFRKGSMVRHEKFGLGIVVAAQRQPDGLLCLVVSFGKQQKRVMSSYLYAVRQ